MEENKAGAPQQVDAVQAVPEGVYQVKSALFDDAWHDVNMSIFERHQREGHNVRRVFLDFASPSPAVPPEPQSPYAKVLEKLLGTQSVPRLTDEPLETWAFRALMEALAGQAAQGAVPEAMVSAAGRALADRSAAACNVNKDDNWKVYGNDFIEDARAALKAAGLTVAQPTDTTAGE